LSNCCAEACGYDKNNRHRGSDEGDSPLLGDGVVVAGEGEVVIGGEECDQAKGKATDGLGDTEAVKSEGADSRPGRGVAADSG
jgi:hypothetical protein